MGCERIRHDPKSSGFDSRRTATQASDGGIQRSKDRFSISEFYNHLIRTAVVPEG
jgi:hypothetical protein